MCGSYLGSTDVAVVPQLEDEQRPELLAIVATARQVVAHQRRHGRAIEESFARDALGREDRQHLLLERTAKPVGDRDPKTFFRPVEDGVGSRPRSARLKRNFDRRPRSFMARGSRVAYSTKSLFSSGTRPSSEAIMLARSSLTKMSFSR